MMKTYEKPVVIENKDLAEGVFAASGDSSSDCWSVSGEIVQSWNGNSNVFQIHAIHSKSVTHISSNVDYVFTFSAPLTSASSEFPCTFSGNTVTVSRTLLADAYYSGDDVTFKVWASTGDEATTRALSITGISYVCTHEVNVQGGID